MATTSPKRHGPPLGHPKPPPQRLELPQELIDIVVWNLRATHLFYPRKFLRNVCKMRKVCRVFYAGLFGEFAEVFSDKTMTFAADYQGLTKLTKLANSRLAPYVLKMKQVKVEDDSPTIDDFFARLTDNGVCFPNLETFEDYDPRPFVSIDTTWLQAHTTNLTQLHIEAILDDVAIEDRHFEPWLALILALIRAPRLTFTELFHTKSSAKVGKPWTICIEHAKYEESDVKDYFEDMAARHAAGNKIAGEAFALMAERE